MLRSPSSLRSLLHHSGRLLHPRSPRFPGSPNPPLPSYPRFPRSRFLSSSSSPTPGAAQWATNDHDSLINSLCASASDTPADADSDVWAVFDPVAGRIVIQRPPPSSSTAEDEMEGEGAGKRREGEEKAGVKEKGKGKRKGRACASGEKGQTGRWSVAAARKPVGKGGKEKVSYECSLCGEAHSQWWGNCRYCNAPGTIQKVREMVPRCDGGPSEEEVKGDDEEKAGVKEKEKKGEGKGKWKRKGRASATGEKGQTSPPLFAAAQKSAGKGGKAWVWYVCSHCWESHPRWWGCCRHCNAVGTLQSRRENEMVPLSSQEVN